MARLSWFSGTILLVGAAYLSEEVLAMQRNDALSLQYLKFVAQYGKSYASKEHMDKKFAIFKENVEKIDLHNSQADVPFSMAVNQFSDMSEEEFLAMYAAGGRPLKKESRRRLQEDSEASWHPEYSFDDWALPVGVEMPAYKNWFEEGFVTRPGNQGQCGACWAFAAASTLETLALMSGFDHELQNYSVQQLIDCNGIENYDCTGGWMFEAFQYSSANGIALRDDYPVQYLAMKGLCQSNFSTHFKNVDQVEIDLLDNESMKAVLQKTPIGVGIYTTGMFQSYSSGVLTEDYLHCSNLRYNVNHGVVVVGYGDTAHDDKVRGHCKAYWIVRNSWGPDWGELGFFRLCMDGAGEGKTPYGACQVNAYGTWPTMKSYLAEDTQQTE